MQATQHEQATMWLNEIVALKRQIREEREMGFTDEQIEKLYELLEDAEDQLFHAIG